MLVSDWLLVLYLIFSVTATHQNSNRKRAHHPDTQTLSKVPHHINTDKILKTETRDKVNRLLLLTVSPNWVRLRPQIVTKKLKRTEMQTLRQKRSMRTVTYNSIIEVDVRTPIVSKKRVPEKMKSDIHFHKSIKHRRANNEDQSVKAPKDINSKDIEPETDSLDTKVLSRIQQLENELNMMKVQVKNDSATIENLKSKVVEKDKEIAELIYINETVPINIDISDLKTQVINESTQRTRRRKEVGSTKNEPDSRKEVNLYVPNRKSFKRNKENILPTLPKSNITFSKGKYLDRNSDKRKHIIQKEHVNEDVINPDKPKYDNNENHIKLNDRNNNQELVQRQINAEKYIKEVTQDGNIEANKIENNAENKYPISGAFNNYFGERTRIEDARNIKDIDKIQFSEKKEFIDPPKTVITEIPSTIDPDIDQLNPNDNRLIVKRRDLEMDYGEGPGQMDIPEGMEVNEDGQLVQDENIGKDEDENADLGNNRNPFLNRVEFEKKLNDERIENAIDWKTFNPKAFLAQISEELKERTRMDIAEGEIPTIAPFSGRRMLSDKAINLTDIDDSPDTAAKLILKTTTEIYAPAPPGQRKVALNSNMVVPEVLRNNEDFLLETTPAVEDLKVSRSPLAPEAGIQKLVVDSTEDLVRNVLRRFSAGKANVPPSLDFDVYKQKLHRNDGKEREKLHQKVAERMKAKISGRRSMNAGSIFNLYDMSEEILKDPFLNDKLI